MRERMAACATALALVVAVVVGTAEAASGATSYTVGVSGVVECSSASDVVTGIRVSTADRPRLVLDWSKASFWRIPGKANAAVYSVSLTVSRSDPKVKMVIECARNSTILVPRTYYSAEFRIRNGAVENERCNSSARAGTVACTPAPKGTSATANLGYRGYCTWGTYEKWKAYAGYYPKIGGDAWKWDDNAKANGFRVTRTPHPMAIVVFDKGVAPGHVGWVTKLTKNSRGQVVITYVDMNGGSGGTAANDWQTSDFGVYRTRTKVWDSSTMWFIVAPRR